MTQAHVMSEPVVVEERFDTVDMNINMGPQHPSTHGVFRMVLTVEGEVVKDAVSYIGYMHRGGEGDSARGPEVGRPRSIARRSPCPQGDRQR